MLRGRRRIALAVAVTLSATACDWSQFRSDAAHTGNVYETVLGVDNVAELTPLWSVEHDLALPGVVTTAGAVVVVADGDALAYEDDTGATRWEVALPPVGDLHRAWQPPSSRDAVVHVGYTNPLFSSGLSGGFLLIDARTGADTDTGRDVGVESPPTFSGEDTWYSYGEVGPLGQGIFLGIEGRLADGRTVRTIEAGTSGASSPPAPAVAGGMVFTTPGGGGSLDAYDATATENCSDLGNFRSCTPLWSAAVSGRAVPAVAGSTVFAASATGIAAYATDRRGPDQQPLWQAEVTGASAVALDPAADAARVFVGSGDGTLKSFAAAGCGVAGTCAPAWQGLTGGAVSAPAVANGVVYVGSADGFVHAFAAHGCGGATCAPLWSAATPGAPTHVVVANGRVHVLTATGELVTFGLP